MHSITRNELNVINTLPRYYMNVGSWGDQGKSDFAMISGNVLVLASWLGDTPEQPVYPNAKAQESLEKLAPIKKFMASCSDLQRGFVKEFIVEESKEDIFTSKDELIVVVGDCHINLLKEWGPDNFIRVPTPSELKMRKTRISMWPDFKQFIDFASNQVAKDKLIHVGDLYDFWEAQNLFEYAGFRLMQMMLTFNPSSIFGVPNMKYTTPTPINKEFPSSLLTRREDFDAAKKKAFSWCEQSNDPLGEYEKTPLYLARYFNIPDPVDLPAPKLKKIYIDRGKYSSVIDVLDPNTPHYAEHRKWVEQAHQAFYDSRPTLRDVLAIIFYGKSAWSHGFSNFTPPISFDATTSWYQRNHGWNEGTLAHFFGQCSNLKMIDDPCDFLDCEQIKEMIQAQYDPATFNKMTCIVGNHDISDKDKGGAYKNHYLELLFKNGDSFEQAKSKLNGAQRGATKVADPLNRLDEDCKLDDPYLTYRCGAKDQVVIEHGHVWDVYNNPKNYSLLVVNIANPVSLQKIGLPDNDFVVDESQLGFNVQPLDGGYHACRGWTVGESYTSSPLYDGDMNDPTYFIRMLDENRTLQTYSISEAGKRVVTPQADFELALACETRMDAIFEKNPRDVALVVMGHTHMPYIINWTDWKANPPSRSPLGATGSGILKGAQTAEKVSNTSPTY